MRFSLCNKHTIHPSLPKFLKRFWTRKIKSIKFKPCGRKAICASKHIFVCLFVLKFKSNKLVLICWTELKIFSDGQLVNFLTLTAVCSCQIHDFYLFETPLAFECLFSILISGSNPSYVLCTWDKLQWFKAFSAHCKQKNSSTSNTNFLCTLQITLPQLCRL